MEIMNTVGGMRDMTTLKVMDNTHKMYNMKNGAEHDDHHEQYQCE